MPLLGPLTERAALHEERYSPLVSQTEQGYVFNMPCNNPDSLIDLSYLKDRVHEALNLNGNRLIVQIPERQLRQMTIVAPDDMEVVAVDPHQSKTKIYVQHNPSNDVHKARGYVSESSDVHCSINGEYHSISNDLKLTRVERSRFLSWITLSGRASYYEGMKGNVGRIFCRHLALASIITALRVKSPDSWQSALNAQLMPSVAPETFAKLAEYEHLARDLFDKSANIRGPIFVEMADRAKNELRMMGREIRRGKHEKVDGQYFMILADSSYKEAGHALHLRLSAQRHDSGLLLYKMKLYDPNDSFIHTSFSTHHLQDITPENFKSLFLKSEGESYEQCYDVSGLVEVTAKKVDKFMGPPEDVKACGIV